MKSVLSVRLDDENVKIRLGTSNDNLQVIEKTLIYHIPQFGL